MKPGCGVEAAVLIAYLGRPAAHPDLHAHVKGCEVCQDNLWNMAVAALSEGPGRRRHLDSIQLADFAHARAAGQPERAQDRELTTHLAWCQECFAQYQEFRMMSEMTLGDLLPLPPRAAYRPPDLSFLHPIWVRAREGSQFVQTLRIGLALLFGSPQPALAPVPARGEPVALTPGEVAAWRQASFGAEQLGMLDVDLRLFTDQARPTLARLEVYAQSIQQLDLDFSGTRVALRFSDGRELARLTDAAGRALFEEVPEVELRTAVLEITPAERRSP